MPRSKGMLQMPPQQLSTDSVICPYCEEILGTYPDDFLDGGKFQQQGTPDNPIIYVCKKCIKSFRISLRKTVIVNTIGVEKMSEQYSEKTLKKVEEIKEKIKNNEIMSEEETQFVHDIAADKPEEELPPDDSSPVDKAHANDSDIIETTIPGLSITKAAIMRDRFIAGEPFTSVEKELLKSILICISEGEPINPMVSGEFDIYEGMRSVIRVADMTGIQYFKAACETTSNKEIKSVDRLIALKSRMYLAEHSPIRMREFWINLANIPSFVSTHLVRHHVGIDHYQMSHRFDRTGTPDEQSNRLTPTNISMHVNAQSLISMARKRLCSKASKETRKVMEVIKEAIRVLDPALAEVMVPECVYRHMCPEEKSCGYIDRLLAEVNKLESEAAEKVESKFNVEENSKD